MKVLSHALAGGRPAQDPMEEMLNRRCMPQLGGRSLTSSSPSLHVHVGPVQHLGHWPRVQLLQQLWLQHPAQHPGQTLSGAALQQRQLASTQPAEQLGGLVTEFGVPV